MESYGKKMTAAGKSMSMSLTAPMALLAGLSVSAASNYSRAMAKTRAVTNATQEEFKDLNEVAKELGRTTEFTATQVGNAMGFMGMAGMETDAILGSINKTLDLATIGQLDMARAADITTNIMSGFGMEADEINRVVDVLAKTITSSNTNVEMLGESMKFVAPVAKGFGMSIEETAAVMGVLGSAGIQSSMAGTTLRNVILELDKEAKNLGISIFDTSGKLLPFADILGILEDQGLSTSEIIETVGKRGGPGLVALLEKGSQGMREYVDDLENVKGYSNEVASDMRKGLHAELDNLKSAFEGLQIAIVDTLMPVLKPMIEKLTEMMRKFSDLDPDMKRIIVTVGVLAAAIGPLLMALGFLVSSFKYVAVGLKVLTAVMLVFLHPLKSITIGIKALGTAIRFFTAHPLILALTALVAVGMYWYKNWDKIVSGAQYLWEGLQVAVISVVNKIIGALNRLPGVDIPLQKINVVTRQASKAVAGLDAEFDSLSQTSEGLKKDLAGLEGELVKNSTSIHDLGKVAEAVGEQSEDAFKEVAESLSSIRKEIEELYDDITKSGDKYRKENENEEESFYESVAGMVAEAEKKIVGLEEDKESTLADLRKERLQAIKDEDEKEIERLDQKIAEERTKTGSK
ncbi:MAG: phage tail tape measure protein, partial [Candidatus Omnitrophica bacterium]|nr:phage tail tape measure protein [Candidatus Omnitrophota bacterium]